MSTRNSVLAGSSMALVVAAPTALEPHRMWKGTVQIISTPWPFDPVRSAAVDDAAVMLIGVAPAPHGHTRTAWRIAPLMMSVLSERQRLAQHAHSGDLGFG